MSLVSTSEENSTEMTTWWRIPGQGLSIESQYIIKAILPYIHRCNEIASVLGQLRSKTDINKYTFFSSNICWSNTMSVYMASFFFILQ